MEGMVSREFWKGKVVLVTGHTGFKGAWLSFWLKKMGAKVIGIGLEPVYKPNIFEEINLKDEITSLYIDIRDKKEVEKVFQLYKPEMVFHLAAQPLVRESYDEPVETYETNVIGTSNILFSAYKCNEVKAVVNITTDKCYENKEWYWSYRECDELGGYDPYSSSKACSEILTASFRKSFYDKKDKLIATVRAGNVIGGGDWSKDRIVPDIIRSVFENDKLTIRSGASIRPFQHVLEPLCGYIMIMEKLYLGNKEFGEAWNFGPDNESIICVEKLTNDFLNILNVSKSNGNVEFLNKNMGVHEAKLLKLDSTKAKEKLKWKPRWQIDKTIESTAIWYKAYYEGKDMKKVTLEQIEEYEES